MTGKRREDRYKSKTSIQTQWGWLMINWTWSISRAQTVSGHRVRDFGRQDALKVAQSWPLPGSLRIPCPLSPRLIHLCARISYSCCNSCHSEAPRLKQKRTTGSYCWVKTTHEEPFPIRVKNNMINRKFIASFLTEWVDITVLKGYAKPAELSTRASARATHRRLCRAEACAHSYAGLASISPVWCVSVS